MKRIFFLSLAAILFAACGEKTLTSYVNPFRPTLVWMAGMVVAATTTVTILSMVSVIHTSAVPAARTMVMCC